MEFDPDQVNKKKGEIADRSSRLIPSPFAPPAGHDSKFVPGSWTR